MPPSTDVQRSPHTWSLIGLVWAIGCGNEAPPPIAQPPTFATAAAISVEPAHGGTVVVAGTQPVEVVPHASGEVHAYVVGAPPPAGAELAVTVPVRDGVRTVELEWNPATVRFEGRVRRVEVVPGPVDVVYVTGGTRWVGHAPSVVVAPAVVVAPTTIEVGVDGPREVIVAPPGPRVVVTPPRPHVVVTPSVQLEVRGKHRKHRRGRGRGRGHGHADVRVRIR